MRTFLYGKFCDTYLCESAAIHSTFVLKYCLWTAQIINE